jgi:hypothetical protein
MAAASAIRFDLPESRAGCIWTIGRTVTARIGRGADETRSGPERASVLHLDSGDERLRSTMSRNEQPSTRARHAIGDHEPVGINKPSTVENDEPESLDGSVLHQTVGIPDEVVLREEHLVQESRVMSGCVV